MELEFANPTDALASIEFELEEIETVSERSPEGWAILDFGYMRAKVVVGEDDYAQIAAEPRMQVLPLNAAGTDVALEGDEQAQTAAESGLQRSLPAARFSVLTTTPLPASDVGESIFHSPVSDAEPLEDYQPPLPTAADLPSLLGA